MPDLGAGTHEGGYLGRPSPVKKSSRERLDRLLTSRGHGICRPNRAVDTHVRRRQLATLSRPPLIRTTCEGLWLIGHGISRESAVERKLVPTSTSLRQAD